MLWSFYWNNRIVFKINDGEKRSVIKSLCKTYITYGVTGILLSNILSYLWIECIGMSKYIAPILNIIICVPLNFILNKYWSFKEEWLL